MKYEIDYEIVHFCVEPLRYAVPEQEGFAEIHFRQMDGRTFQGITLDRGPDGEWMVCCKSAQVGMLHGKKPSFRPVGEAERQEVEEMVLAFMSELSGAIK